MENSILKKDNFSGVRALFVHFFSGLRAVKTLVTPRCGGDRSTQAREVIFFTTSFGVGVPILRGKLLPHVAKKPNFGQNFQWEVKISHFGTSFFATTVRLLSFME